MFVIKKGDQVYSGIVHVGRRKVLWSDTNAGMVNAVLFRDTALADAVIPDIAEIGDGTKLEIVSVDKI